MRQRYLEVRQDDVKKVAEEYLNVPASLAVVTSNNVWPSLTISLTLSKLMNKDTAMGSIRLTAADGFSLSA